MKPQPITPEIITTPDARECYRVPPGTFLRRPVRSGALHFEDASGEALAHGINGGDPDPYYEYVGGDDGIRAIVEFPAVSDHEFADGDLQLALRCRILRTRFIDLDPVQLLVCVRNPVNGVESAPLKVGLTSEEEVKLVIPRSLSSQDDSVSKELDLRTDLISNGRLQVCISLDTPFSYCGVGRQSVQLVHGGNEYVHISNKLVIVSDSEERLSGLLDAQDGIERILNAAGPSFEFAGRFDTASERKAVREFAGMECGFEAAADFVSEVSEANGSLDLREGTTFRMSLLPSDASRTKALCTLLIERIADWWVNCRKNSRMLVGSESVRTYLVSLVFDGVPASFPAKAMPPEQRLALVEACVGRPEDAPQLALKDGRIEATFSRPPVPFAGSEQRTDFLANVYCAAGYRLIQSSRSEQADLPLRLATDLCRGDAGCAMRVSHMYGFNAPRGCFDLTRRYAFVRRGLVAILKSLEHSRQRSDHLWLLGRLIARKIGYTARDMDLNPLFMNDHPLQEQIQEAIEFPVQSGTWDSEAWAVSANLLSAAIDGQSSSNAGGGIVPPILLYSERAFVAARTAEMLLRRGRVEDSEAAWTRTRELYDQLERMRLIRIGTEDYSLSDLANFTDEQSQESAVMQRLKIEQERTELLLRRAMCEVGTANAMREAMSLIYRANHSLSSPGEVMHLYCEAFRKLDQSFQQDQERLAVAELTDLEWQIYERMRASAQLQEDETLTGFRQMQELRQAYQQKRMLRLEALVEELSPDRPKE